MSDPKTVTQQRDESQEAVADDQQCAPSGVCCERIRVTAYSKWEAAGCPCGDGVEFWLQAEAELAAEPSAEGEPSKP